jgi:abhydrolase domain-containing protein 12
LSFSFSQGLKAPLLIVHAEDDVDIPVWHAQALFDAFLEKHLPPLTEVTAEMMDAPAGRVEHCFPTLIEQRAARRKELVTVCEMERMGLLKLFSNGREHGKVVFLHTWWGGHDVGLLEGVQDYMAEMFRMV